MHQTETEIEKRKFARLDTSDSNDWIIRIYGDRGKPVEGNIINLSLGGVAFVGPWEKVARTINRYPTKTEIVLPNGKVVAANSTLLRVLPKKQNNKCICAMLFSDFNPNSIRHLQSFIPS